ncbi:unnamed protein product [Closterium sp. Naga37s-1]|nr:unnamed protein product [Closterium sp. Naga37s-1]
MRERKGPAHPSSSRNGAGAHRSSRNSWLRFFFPGPSSSSGGGGGGGSSRRIGSWLLLLCLVVGFVYWVLVLQLLVGFAEQKELISETRHRGFVKWERHRHVFPWKIGLTAHPHVVPRDRLGKRWGRKRRARKRAAKLKAQARAQPKPGGVKGGNKTAQIGAGGGAEKKAGAGGSKKLPAAGGGDAGAGKSGASGAGKDKGSGGTASADAGKGGSGSGAKNGEFQLEGAQLGKAGSGVGGDAGKAKAVAGGGGGSGMTSNSSSSSSSVSSGSNSGDASGRAGATERSAGGERTGGGGGGEASGEEGSGRGGWWRRRRRARRGELTPIHLDLYKRRKAARAASAVKAARTLQASSARNGSSSREGVMGGAEGEGVCVGEECPVFGNCEGELIGVAACWNKGLHDPLLARPRSPSTCPRLGPAAATNSSAGAGATGAAAGAAAAGNAGSGSRAVGRAAAAAARSALCGHEADFELLPQWMSQVFRLESVRVDAWGRVFNGTTLFHSNACPAPTDRPSHTNPSTNHHVISDSQVQHQQQQQQQLQQQQPYTRASVPRPSLHLPLAVNLALPHPLHASDALVHYLPLLLALHSSLAAMPLMSFLVGTAGEGEAGGGGGWGERGRGRRKGKGLSGFFGGKGGREGEGEGEGVHSSQEGALLLLGAEVTGVDFGRMDVRELRGQDVVLVDILLQPVHQRCHKPSRALWQTLRHHYLLPPNGFPIFNPDFTLQAPSEADAAAAAAVEATDDWVVVWGKRPGAGTAEELAELHLALVEAFGARRLRTVGGSAALDLLTVKRTFNRARVLVAPHAPLLNHMVFMPPRAVVLELRPQGAQGSEYAVFHRLADACGLDYHLLLCQGEVPWRMGLGNMSRIVEVLRGIAESFGERDVSQTALYREEPDGGNNEMATATSAQDMEVRLKEMLNSMVLKVQVGEMAGGVEVRVAALEAKLREQGDAMAAMQRDMAEMRRAMALLKGIAAAGASAEKSEGGGAGQGSASGESAEGIGAQLPKGARESIVAALEVEEVKVRVEAARGEARDAASKMRGEMGALKAELAQLKEAAEQHAAEVADVKATAARINDLELALAALKDGRAEKNSADRSEGSAGEHAEAERHEGKRRKRDEACKEEEMADAAVGVGPPLFTDGGAVVEKRDEAEKDGEAKGRKNHGARDTKSDLQRLMALVEAVENTSASGSKMWEDSTDAALEGIGSLKNLRALDLFNTKVTDAGVAKLQGMTSLVDLILGACAAVTDASMVHVAKLTALESLTLSDTGVTEDGLRRLSSLAALKILILPPGVTDSGMKHLRNMKRLEKLGLWDAKITAAGVKWLNGHKWLQTIATDAEDVAELIRDIFPGMIVTPVPL